MVYFAVEDLVGRNSKEAYDYYIFQINWLRENLPEGSWRLDTNKTLCYNGVVIASGIYIDDFHNAFKFCRVCL